MTEKHINWRNTAIAEMGQNQILKRKNERLIRTIRSVNEDVEYLKGESERYRMELETWYEHAKELSEQDINMSSIAVKNSIEKVLEESE